MSDEYCFSEKCQYRHWRSGSMPTHRKGDGCPKPHTPTTGEVEDDYAYNEWDTDAEEEEMPRREAFRRWHAAEILRAKAEAWDEGYRQGIDDERTAEALQVGIGLGGYATANRSNPYREATT